MFTTQQIRTHLETALQLAEKAFNEGNYPIGAVFTDTSGKVVTEAKNECTSLADVTAHAEIVGIRALGNAINKYTDGEHYLFTSLEPCFGCSFFVARTNIKTVYSALKDPHKGGTSDLADQKQFANFFKNIEFVNEPFADLAEKSRELMRRYFLRIGNEKAASFYGYQK